MLKKSRKSAAVLASICADCIFLGLILFERPALTGVEDIGFLILSGVILLAISTATFYSIVVRMDERYYRPAEVEQLLGNPAKAKKQLGWEPKVKFEELVEIMVKGDLRLLDNPCYETGF